MTSVLSCDKLINLETTSREVRFSENAFGHTFDPKWRVALWPAEIHVAEGHVA